jgi:hypothetical protein
MGTFYTIRMLGPCICVQRAQFEPGVHATFACDHEYKRLGTVSLLAGVDLVTGQVHALVKDRHRSREFVEFLQLLDAAWEAVAAELVE